MENQSNQQRIKAIYQMLFEMATGNLTFRLDISDDDDKVDNLSKVLNTLAAEIHSVILQSGYVNPHYSYQNLIQTTFILNDKFIITGFSSDVLKTLHINPEELINKDFGNVVAPKSEQLWNELKHQATEDKNYHNTVQLTLTTANKKLIPTFCTVSRLLYSNKIVVSSVTTILRELLADAPHYTETGASKMTETEIIQNLYDYILNHLEQPLPTLKELSVLFDTNEYKLKQGFRELFKTSIYNFYNEERLKRAHLMIQQTAIPLKEIAILSGFNSYLNFYKAFKKRFQCSPRDVDRGENQPA